MKRNILKSVIFIILLLRASFALAADTYTMDPMHTYVMWHINHFGFSNPSGKWMAEGKIVYDEAKPENSTVSVKIPLAQLATGLPALDKHLVSPDFFDVTKYPIATFTSKEIKVTGANTANIQGVLTVHGVSKPVTLDVTLNKKGISPITNKMTLGLTASTMVKRSDFGISAYLPGLGDDVKLDIEVEANQ